MRVVSCYVSAMLVAVGSMIGCATSGPAEVAQGVISVNLVGHGSSGAIYRLRDGVITVHGPNADTVWNTEDNPDRTSLSANVVPGDYTASLQEGWRLERVDGTAITAVTAVLISDNPAYFTVTSQQRTTVPLSFRVDTDLVVDLAQGYDIVLDIHEAPLAQIAVVSFVEPRAISIFGAHDSGNVAPRRSITSAALGDPFTVAVVGGEAFLPDHAAAAVNVFDITAHGDAAPIRRIIGPDTTLQGPFGATVYNGEIYVMDTDAVLKVFPLTASGNVAPTRTLSGFPNPAGITINRGEIYFPRFSPPSIQVFPANASGNAVPIRTITVASSGGQVCPIGIAIRNDDLFLGEPCGHAIRVYPRTGNGDVAPTRTIFGPNTGLALPSNIISLGDEIYVSDPGSVSIQVYPLHADGDVAPLRVLTGPATGLDAQLGLAIF